MTTMIQKWGNSCAVRLPHEILRKLDLRAGNDVEIREDANGVLSIIPAPHAAASLSEMISRITKNNRHVAADWGGAVGREVW